MDCGKKEVTIPNSICKEVEKILATREEQKLNEFSDQIYCHGLFSFFIYSGNILDASFRKVTHFEEITLKYGL